VGKHRLYSISCWTIIYSILTTTILTDASGYLLEFWLVFLPWLMILSYFSYTSFPVVLIYLLIYLFLGGTVVCTQGLDLLTWALYMTWVTPPACFALACFSDLVPLFFPKLASTHDPLYYASHIAGIIGMGYHIQLVEALKMNGFNGRTSEPDS
jgi:hypothetical protein